MKTWNYNEWLAAICFALAAPFVVILISVAYQFVFSGDMLIDEDRIGAAVGVAAIFLFVGGFFFSFRDL